MNNIFLFAKKKLRNIYYYFINDQIVKLTKPQVLLGKRWITNKNYGRAYYKGYYEPIITDFLIKKLNESSIFFDVGSHAGYFSLLATCIAKNGKVISFEPMPDNCLFIKKIRQLNNVKNWEIYNTALSNEKGEVGFKLGSSSSTGKVVEKTSSDIIVKTQTLDTFIIQNSFLPDLIKIDVEGHGDSVLKGFNILEDYPKKIVILFEIHNNSNELQYVKENFGNSDFKILDLSGKKIDFQSNHAPSHLILTNSQI